jgi:glutamate 5-kinase
VLDKRKRVVIKVGTGVLTKPAGSELDTGQFRRLTAEIAQEMENGIECLLVSSGAVGAGMMLLNLDQRPTDLPSIQACAAVGQSRLMRLYEGLFAKYKLRVAQLLLTHDDIDSRTRYKNARNTIEHLLRFGNVIPIINENDSVAVDELNRKRDNDTLSAEVAQISGADLLIILTSAEGLLDQDGRRIAVIDDIDSVMHHVRQDIGLLSKGGMQSKLQAMKVAHEAGIPGVIGSGRVSGIIGAAIRGEDVGSRFPSCCT